MKILYIENVENKVGNFSYSSTLAAQNLGMEFHIAASWTGYDKETKKNDEKKYGIKIFQIDFMRNPYDIRNINAYKQMCQLIRKEKYDIIHCNTPIGGCIGRLAAKKCGIKRVIYQVHGFHFYKGAPIKNWLIYYPIENWLAHYTNYIITINKEDYLIAQKLKLKNKGEVFYVPGVGIDLSVFRNMQELSKGKRDELKITEDSFVIISAGELNNNKNNEVIIEALHSIHSKKIIYILCGVGDKKEYLESLVKKYGLEDNIKFLKYRTDVKELMMISDLFVMPSFREGLSRSIMEAMACGLPCVVSKIRGNVDLLDNEKGGYVCDVADINAYIKAINNLSSSKELCIKMQEYNLKKIEKFSLDLVVEEIKKIYKKVMED